MTDRSNDKTRIRSRMQATGETYVVARRAVMAEAAAKRGDAVPGVPPRALWHGDHSRPWNEFPLGLDSEGREAVWDCAAHPIALVAGPTGSGKSVLQRIVLLHALRSPEWRIAAVDLKRVELPWLDGLDGVLRVATTLEDGVTACEDADAEITRRQGLMTDAGAGHFRDLDPRPPALLLMVDETFPLLAPNGTWPQEEEGHVAMRARAAALLASIARRGPSAGVHLVLATQRPDADVLPDEVKARLGCRIATGRMDAGPSQAVLGSDAAVRLPKIKGRSLVRLGDELTEFMTYFVPLDDVLGPSGR